MDIVQLLLGSLILLLPGAAVTLVLAPRLDWAKTLFVAIVAAATILPAVMYASNYFFGVPLTATNAVLASLWVSALTGAAGLSPRLARAWE